MLRAAFLGGIDGGLMKPEIMIGELGVGLGGGRLAKNEGTMRQGQIVPVQLLRVAAKLHLRPVGLV